MKHTGGETNVAYAPHPDAPLITPHRVISRNNGHELGGET